MRTLLASVSQKVHRGGQLAKSELRKTVLRLRYPGFSADRKTFIGPGCDVHIEPGGSIVLRGCAVTRSVTLTSGRAGTLAINACYLGPGSTLVAREAVIIGAGTMIAENAVIRDANHDHSRPLSDMRFTSRPIVVGADVWVGAGAMVLLGTTVGDHTSIGAGAVVTKSIPPHSVAVGVPARHRPKTWRSETV